MHRPTSIFLSLSTLEDSVDQMLIEATVSLNIEIVCLGNYSQKKIKKKLW